MTDLSIALVGDHDPAVLAQQAIPIALELTGAATGLSIHATWVETMEIDATASAIRPHDGVWVVPASPYANFRGAIAAIRLARRSGMPLLGTCGGFQHLVLEVAEDVWGIESPAHAELDPEARDPIIARLSCGLVEKQGRVRFAPASRIGLAYGTDYAIEGYHCNYGISPTFRDRFDAGPLRATAWDDAGDIRGVELDGHPFFVGTLFQPERLALRGVAPPLVIALLGAMSMVPRQPSASYL